MYIVSIRWLTSNAIKYRSKSNIMTKTDAVKIVLEQMETVRSHDPVDNESRQYAYGQLFSVIGSILGVSDASMSNRFRKIEDEFNAGNN